MTGHLLEWKFPTEKNRWDTSLQEAANITIIIQNTIFKVIILILSQLSLPRLRKGLRYFFFIAVTVLRHHKNMELFFFVCYAPEVVMNEIKVNFYSNE